MEGGTPMIPFGHSTVMKNFPEGPFVASFPEIWKKLDSRLNYSVTISSNHGK
jgi:hypothetical protein